MIPCGATVPTKPLSKPIEAINQDVPTPVITLAILMRFVSRQEESYAAKLLAAMRNQFGGHGVMRKA